MPALSAATRSLRIGVGDAVRLAPDMEPEARWRGVRQALAPAQQHLRAAFGQPAEQGHASAALPKNWRIPASPTFGLLVGQDADHAVFCSP